MLCFSLYIVEVLLSIHINNLITIPNMCRSLLSLVMRSNAEPKLFNILWRALAPSPIPIPLPKVKKEKRKPPLKIPPFESGPEFHEKVACEHKRRREPGLRNLDRSSTRKCHAIAASTGGFAISGLEFHEKRACERRIRWTVLCVDLRDQRLGYGIKNEEFGSGSVEKETRET